MNLKTAKRLRAEACYYPGKTDVEYEKPQLHHIARMPQYERYKKTGHIILGADGRSPRTPVFLTVNNELIAQSEMIPIAKPARLKKGSNKLLYRLLKKQA